MDDYHGSNEEKFAQESWDIYNHLNTSVISEQFAGQLKSKLECNKCKYVSITYDPYLMLTLPIPDNNSTIKKCQFVQKNPFMIPNHFSIIFHNDKPIMYQTDEIMQIFKGRIDSKCDKLEIASIKDNKVHKIINDKTTLVETEGILFVQESNNDTEEIMYYEKAFQKSAYNPEDNSFLDITNVLQPVLLKYNATTNIQEIYSKILLNSVLQLNEFKEQAKIQNKNQKKSILTSTFIQDNINIPYETVLFDKQFNNIALKQQPFAVYLKYYKTVKKMQFFTSTETVLWYIPPSEETLSDILAKLNLSDEERLSLKLHVRYNLDLVDNDRFTDCQHIQDKKTEMELQRTQERNRHTFKLSDCFNIFGRTEQLDNQNQWQCKKCDASVNAYKTMRIQKLPVQLIIFLKRFKVDGHHKSKKIDFPLHEPLDLTPQVNDPNAKYELQGIINHYGGMGGGQQKAYSKNIIDRQWQYQDDSKVTKKEPDAETTSSAYVFFYKRLDNTQ